MRNWYGIRRLFEPRFRTLAERLLVVLLVGYYVLYAAIQWWTLDADALRFDFLNYFRGAEAAAHHTNIYADFVQLWGTQAWVVAYIYPPLFALALAPLTLIGPIGAGRVWLLVVHAAFLSSLWLILRIHPELPPSGRRLFLAAAFAFMPVYLTLRFQQVATLWLLLLTATLWAALRRRDLWAGIFLALAASLKVVPMLLIPLFVRVGRLRIAVSAAIALVTVTLFTLLLSPQSWTFFTVVLPRIGLGNANWDNGSIGGLISRLVTFFPGIFGPQTRVIAALAMTGVAGCVFGISLLRAPAKPTDWQLRLTFAAFITALLMVSSVTWQHHLVTLLLPFAVAATWIHARRAGPLTACCLGLSYALCWVDRRIFPLPADQVVRSSIEGIFVLAGTSIKLVGLILLWTLLLTMLRRESDLVRQPALSTARAALPPAA